MKLFIHAYLKILFLNVFFLLFLKLSHSKGIEGTSYHESLYNALQSLRDREFSTFYESLKYARYYKKKVIVF